VRDSRIPPYKLLFILTKNLNHNFIQISHIPTDLVVAQEASPVESSSRLDFLLLHNLGMSFVAP